MKSNPQSDKNRIRQRPERLLARLRQISGLVMIAFISMHLANHAMGIISLSMMESLRKIHEAIWLNPAGKTILMSAFSIHFLLALRALFIRTTLRMSKWELIQILSGLGVSLLIAGHVVQTLVVPLILGIDIGYSYLIGAFWADDWLRFRLPLLLVVAWTHAAIGLHFWLRLKSWYLKLLPFAGLLMCILPLLALLGFARAGMDMQIRHMYPDSLVNIFSSPFESLPEQLTLIKSAFYAAPRIILLLIVLTLAARWIRLWYARRQPNFTVHHPDAGKIPGLAGQSILEVLRAAGVPHASICGGRARCTTCRINIDRGLEALKATDKLETSALKRVKAGPTIRLACQTRPLADVWITPLFPPYKAPGEYRTERGISGQEQEVVAMFVDLREFSGIAESHLPYDVVLILNQFLEHMSAALEQTGGHLVQFTGDGLFALFGLKGEVSKACKDAIRCMIEMQNRLSRLNEHLCEELKNDLKIGIGIHCGEAIVGPMGPPGARVISAIGDSVNIASRLEAATKQFGSLALVSGHTLARAGIELSDKEVEHIHIRGRQQSLAVYPVYDATEFKSQRETSRFNQKTLAG